MTRHASRRSKSKRGRDRKRLSKSSRRRSRNRSDRRRSRNRERRRVGGKQVLQTYRGDAPPLNIDSILVGRVYKIGPFNKPLPNYRQMGLKIIAAQYQLYTKRYPDMFSDGFIDVRVTSKDGSFIGVETYPEAWVKDDVTLLVDDTSFYVFASGKKSKSVALKNNEMTRYPKRTRTGSATPTTGESPPAKKPRIAKPQQPEYHVYCDEFGDLRHGKRISVFWDGDNKWFRGTIQLAADDPDKFTVHYDDGETWTYERGDYPPFRIFRTGVSSDAGATGSSSKSATGSSSSAVETVKSSVATVEIQQPYEPVVKFEDGESVFYDFQQIPCTIISLMPRKKWYNVRFPDGQIKSIPPEKLHRSNDDFSRHVATIPDVSAIEHSLHGEDVQTGYDQQVFTVFDGDGREHKIVLEGGKTSTYKLVLPGEQESRPNVGENWLDFLNRMDMHAMPPHPTTSEGKPVNLVDLYGNDIASTSVSQAGTDAAPAYRATSKHDYPIPRPEINTLCMDFSEKKITFENVSQDKYSMLMRVFTNHDEFEMTWFLLTAIFQPESGTIVVRTYDGLLKEILALLNSATTSEGSSAAAA